MGHLVKHVKSKPKRCKHDAPGRLHRAICDIQKGSMWECDRCGALLLLTYSTLGDHLVWYETTEAENVAG